MKWYITHYLINMVNIRNLDLNLLKAFDALMDERNVTRAATRLALTQPAVSSILTRLRDSFDDPLFVRSQRGVIPTPRAQELSMVVKRILAEIDSMLRPTAFDPANSDLTITIAATDYALRAVVLPFILFLRTQAPGIRVAVKPVVAEQVTTQLERGELDLALLTPDTTAPELHARHLFDEHYICVMRSGHPAAKETPLSLETFCQCDQAIVSLGGDSFRGVTDTALEQHGYKRNVVVSLPSFLALADILQTTDLIAVVPRKLVAGQDGLVMLPPPINVPGFSKVLAWHERTHHDPAHNWLRNQLAAMFR